MHNCREQIRPLFHTCLFDHVASEQVVFDPEGMMLDEETKEVDDEPEDVSRNHPVAFAVYRLVEDDDEQKLVDVSGGVLG